MTDWVAKQRGEAIAEKEKERTKKEIKQSMEEAKVAKLTRLVHQFNSPIRLLCFGFCVCVSGTPIVPLKALHIGGVS